MKDRIRLIMESEGLNAAQFSTKVKINSSSLSHILNGRSLPSFEAIYKILDAYPELDANWLLTGKGEMKRDLSALQVDDYPQLFDENSISQPAVPLEDENATLKRSKPAISARKLFDTQNNKEENGSAVKISKIVVFYTDNTFQEFLA